MRVADHLLLLREYARGDTLIVRRLSRALGDNVLLTAVVREIRRASPDRRIVVETAFPELFRHSPYVAWAVDAHWRILTDHHVRPKYELAPGVTPKPLLEQLFEQCPIPLSDPQRRPELFLSDEERRAFATRYRSDAVVIAPVSKGTHAADRKEWGIERFQQVVDARPGWRWVQTGALGDPLLRGAEDLRGLPVRETAGLLSRARLFLGLEGGLMHLARAVECPAVIVYGGAVAPEVSGYPEHVTLSRRPECAPCLTSYGPMTPCPHGRACLTQISVDEVLAGLSAVVGPSAILR